MPIFTVRGCTIEVASGGQSASGKRPEIREGEIIIQSAAFAEFIVREGLPTPEVQAVRWAIGLPRLFEPTPPVVAEAATDHVDEPTAIDGLPTPPSDDSDLHNHPAIAETDHSNG